MRSLALLAAVLSIATGISVAGDNSFLRIEQASNNGTVHFIGKNVSNSPIVAYVVVVERPDQRTIWKGVYTGGDALGVHKTVELGDVPSASGQSTVFVDYVRLADGTAWGNTTTAEAKEVAARFQK